MGKSDDRTLIVSWPMMELCTKHGSREVDGLSPMSPWRGTSPSRTRSKVDLEKSEIRELPDETSLVAGSRAPLLDGGRGDKRELGKAESETCEKNRFGMENEKDEKDMEKDNEVNEVNEVNAKDINLPTAGHKYPLGLARCSGRELTRFLCCPLRTRLSIAAVLYLS